MDLPFCRKRGNRCSSGYREITALIFFILSIFGKNVDCWNAHLRSIKNFPEVTLIGVLDESDAFRAVDNITVDISAVNPSITLKCVASYPIEWVFEESQLISDNLRTWNINYVRRVSDYNDRTTYVFETNLTFFYRPPIEARQITCRSMLEERAMQTKISSKYHGSFIRMTAKSFIGIPTRAIPRYGKNPDCNISLTYNDKTSKICCRTNDTGVFRRGCSDFPSCRSFYTATNCSHQATLLEDAVASAEGKCMDYESIVKDGTAGVVVCKKDNEEDSHSATLNYFPSIRHMCPRIKENINPRLYINVENPPSGDNMLELCDPDQNLIYVGEVVTFQCHGSYYYFSGGMRWIIRRRMLNNSQEELLDASEEIFSFSNAAQEKQLIKATRSLKTNIAISHADIYELACVAPVWHNFEWVSKSIRLDVKEPTNISFVEGSDIVPILYNANTEINCSATGDPMPQVYWAGLPTELFNYTSQNLGWASVKFPYDITSLPNNFILTCVANQDSLQNRMVFKYYDLKEEEKVDASIYLPFLSLILIPAVLIIFCILAKMYIGRWKRTVNKAERDEFFEGTYVKLDEASGVSVNHKANSMPYNTKFEISSKDLKITRKQVIGEGEYGICFCEKMKKCRLKPTGGAVVAKTIKPFADISILKGFLAELKLQIFVGDGHENIVNLIGAQTAKLYKREVYIVTEYCENGDLLSFVRAKGQSLANDVMYKVERKINSNNLTQNASARHYVNFGILSLSPYYFMKWAKEIAQGLSFLRSKGVIHGDISARNILLSGNLTAKIGDFGLSHQVGNYRIFYSPDYNMKVPVKWLAPECLQTFQFSVWSDIWAYGVTLWEIFSLGERPWGEYLDQDVDTFKAALLNGETLKRPRFASERIHEKILECCRVAPPQSRPTPESLAKFFNEEIDIFTAAEGILGDNVNR